MSFVPVVNVEISGPDAPLTKSFRKTDFSNPFVSEAGTGTPPGVPEAPDASVVVPAWKKLDQSKPDGAVTAGAGHVLRLGAWHGVDVACEMSPSSWNCSSWTAVALGTSTTSATTRSTSSATMR